MVVLVVVVVVEVVVVVVPVVVVLVVVVLVVVVVVVPVGQLDAQQQKRWADTVRPEQVFGPLGVQATVPKPKAGVKLF